MKNEKFEKSEYIALEEDWNKEIQPHRPSQRWDWRPWSSEKPWFLSCLSPEELITVNIEYEGGEKSKRKIKMEKMESSSRWKETAGVHFIVGKRELFSETFFFFFRALPLSLPLIYSIAIVLVQIV